MTPSTHEFTGGIFHLDGRCAFRVVKGTISLLIPEPGEVATARWEGRFQIQSGEIYTPQNNVLLRVADLTAPIKVWDWSYSERPGLPEEPPVPSGARFHGREQPPLEGFQELVTEEELCVTLDWIEEHAPFRARLIEMLRESVVVRTSKALGAILDFLQSRPDGRVRAEVTFRMSEPGSVDVIQTMVGERAHSVIRTRVTRTELQFTHLDVLANVIQCGSQLARSAYGKQKSEQLNYRTNGTGGIRLESRQEGSD